MSAWIERLSHPWLVRVAGWIIGAVFVAATCAGMLLRWWANRRAGDVLALPQDVALEELRGVRAVGGEVTAGGILMGYALARAFCWLIGQVGDTPIARNTLP